MQQCFKWGFVLSFFMAYSLVFVQLAPCPPLPGGPPTPVGGEGLHYATVAAVFGYTAWRMYKK
jgi:hypothetical protein